MKNKFFLCSCKIYFLNQNRRSFLLGVAILYYKYVLYIYIYIYIYLFSCSLHLLINISEVRIPVNL
jgi:hypothetical protein